MKAPMRINAQKIQNLEDYIVSQKLFLIIFSQTSEHNVFTKL